MSTRLGEIYSNKLRIHILHLETHNTLVIFILKALKCPTILKPQYSDIFQTYFNMKPFLWKIFLILCGT